MKHLFLTLFAVALVVTPVAGQETYKARLRPVPVDNTTARTIKGSGQATATLSGSKLTVNGNFEGLSGAATVAKIHQGAKMGVRGNAILDLTVAKSPAGAISGTVDLSPAQVEALKSGRLYIQVHAEQAPEGNIWGWLTK